VANRARIERELEQLDPDTNLVVLPEMFTTGFSMNAQQVAEDQGEVTLTWMQAQAQHYAIALCGSLAVRDQDKIYNRLLFVTPDGKHYQYDKRHLFRMSGEDQHYAAGKDRVIVEWRGWRICPLVCYDLRFPVWSRNRDDYDLLLYIANWPEKRRSHWRTLLVARAIENQSYCIGLNRVGSDENGLDYSGDSLVLAADGEVLLDCKAHSGLYSARLDYQKMISYREKFPCHRDADNFRLDP